MKIVISLLFVLGVFAAKPLFSLDFGDDPIVIKKISAKFHEPSSMLKVDCSLQVPSPWHLNSDSVPLPFLIPTKLSLADSLKGVFARKQFPEPIVKTLFGKQLLIFEGEVSFQTYFHINKGEAFPVEVILQYQSCDDKMCNPPKHHTIVIEKSADNTCTATIKRKKESAKGQAD